MTRELEIALWGKNVGEKYDPFGPHEGAPFPTKQLKEVLIITYADGRKETLYAYDKKTAEWYNKLSKEEVRYDGEFDEHNLFDAERRCRKVSKYSVCISDFDDAVKLTSYSKFSLSNGGTDWSMCRWKL